MVTPDDYERWRQSAVGAITEGRVVEAIFGLMGPLTGMRLLDVGCGDGTYAIEAARRGAQVDAVDASAAMIGAARRRAADVGVSINLHVADVKRLPFDADTFDVVVAVTVLCFLPDAAAALKEMARVIRPGGRLVVGELNRWSIWAAWRRLRSWFGSPLWRQAAFRSPRQLSDLVRRSGLTLGRIQGAVYYPPITPVARLLAPTDSVLAGITTIGAAFIAVTATKPPGADPGPSTFQRTPPP
ncbi:MAG: class I SAM-dependent methyltransferase [Actinomycetota bacterium]